MSNNNYNLEEDEKELSAIEMVDKLLVLWNDYFAAPKKNKPKLMEEYNKLAQHYNDNTGNKIMVILTDQTKDSIKTRPANVSVVSIAEQNYTTDVPKNSHTNTLNPLKKEGSIIERILALHKAGKTNKEIIAAGFNKSTVGRQVSEYKKLILK